MSSADLPRGSPERHAGSATGLLPAPDGDAPGGTPEEMQPARTVLGLLALAVAFVPVVTPKIPGHAGPVDVVMVLVVLVALLWAMRRRAPLRLPYAIPVGGLIATGLLA